jgi:hypothetical protein
MTFNLRRYLPHTIAAIFSVFIISPLTIMALDRTPQYKHGVEC